MKGLTFALGFAALVAAAPLAAKPGNGNGHGQGMGAVMGGGHGRAGMGGLGADLGIGLDARDTARLNSRGPMHASDRAIERANANSVLSGTLRSDTRLRAHASQRRLHSRGAMHASARARVRANSHSAIHGSTGR